MLLRMVLYPTVPLTTWYSKMDINCSVLRFPITEPIDWNATLEGANIVTSESELAFWTRFADVRAPATEVRLAAAAVLESDAGRVRTVSMI